MVDSTISRARLRDLAALGRFGLTGAGEAVSLQAYASPRRLLADAASIAEEPPWRPRAPSSRPGSDDLVESTIYGASVFASFPGVGSKSRLCTVTSAAT